MTDGRVEGKSLRQIKIGVYKAVCFGLETWKYAEVKRIAETDKVGEPLQTSLWTYYKRRKV